jgi:signal transduction histidine kinase
VTFAGPRSVFKYQSGRVIALGRIMLSALFLLSIWLDQSQPAQAPHQTYALLLLYVLSSIALAALCWRNWWLDARLAAPAHLLDMAVFTGIIFSTNGYTSPFFLFFILPLLSAAIRWGWRETMITAAALVLLYLAGGLLVAGSEAFELQRFIVRSGHLVILSAVLIWFGIHQQFTRLFFDVDEAERDFSSDEDPHLEALSIAMSASQARSGALVMSSADGTRFSGIAATSAGARPVATGSLLREDVSVLLFRIAGDRSLCRASNGWYRFSKPSRLLESDSLRNLGVAEGMIAEVRTGTQNGWLVLWDISDLSVDFLELGNELGRAAAAVLERQSLFFAIQERTAATTRLSLARDVHDSLVQFLAGAAFRVEAMVRRSNSGEKIETDLHELKRLLIEEQGEIRAFVSALRRDRELELAEAVEELKAVGLRLSKQWSVECRIDATNDDASIPIRMQFDLQQLLREAVANAVRHGRASRIDVDVGVDEDQLRMEVKDNGSGFLPADGETPVQPWSLKERVDRAHGSLSLHSRPGCTNVVITLPLAGAAA